MKTNLLLLAAVAALTVLPFLKGSFLSDRSATFEGTDGQAEKTIAETNPGYVPWVQPIWEPPGSEIESLLFGVQAAIGAALIGYCIGFYRARRRFTKEGGRS